MEGEIKIFLPSVVGFWLLIFFWGGGGGERGGGGRWSLPFCDIGSFTCILP